MATDDEGSGDPSTRAVERHEFLHFAQIGGSTFGLFDSLLARSVLGNHLTLQRLMHLAVPQSPFIRFLSTVSSDGEAYEALLGFQNVNNLRRSLRGYAVPPGKQDPDHATVFTASQLFRTMHHLLFPGEDGGWLKDLDGREAYATRQMAAAPEYPADMRFGAAAVCEAFASAAQTVAASSAPRDWSGEIAVSKLLMESGDPDVVLGAWERLATAAIAGDADLGTHHPWTTRASDSISATYRAGALLLFQEVADLDPSLPITETLVAFAELALNAAILPGHSALWPRKPRWSDVHPGYRYANLCHCVHRLGFAPTLQVSQPDAWSRDMWTYLDSVCEYMEWPLHSEIVAANIALEPGLTTFQSTFGTGFQVDAFARLNRLKAVSLTSTLFGRHRGGDLPGPAAIVRHVPSGRAIWQMADVDGLRAGILTTVLDECYFGTGVDVARSLFDGLETAGGDRYADLLEETLRIEGLANALLR